MEKLIKVKSTALAPITKVIDKEILAIANGQAFLMTKKEKLFCECYVKEMGNVLKAQKAAGVSQTISDNILKKKKNLPALRYIKELQKAQKDAVKKEFGYDAVTSFKHFKKAQTMAVNKKKIIISKSHGIMTFKDPDIPSYIKAEEMKGRLFGLYSKDDEKGNGVTNINIMISGRETIGSKRISPQNYVDAEVVNEEN